MTPEVLFEEYNLKTSDLLSSSNTESIRPWGGGEICMTPDASVYDDLALWRVSMASVYDDLAYGKVSMTILHMASVYDDLAYGKCDLHRTTILHMASRTILHSKKSMSGGLLGNSLIFQNKVSLFEIRTVTNWEGTLISKLESPSIMVEAEESNLSNSTLIK
ncbi:hypothetical protein CEXT_94881 [Caerostris extrusa]|uniref:Uncharacterized protein n=1 Tax=Caerostris extrusa TaxID=172846 RepID=A0AAV4PTJ4_CAEEX|nr:hypothetical protein CEXT_94881 [Caerostris extrusa]